MKVKLLLLALILLGALLCGSAYSDYKDHKNNVAKANKTQQSVSDQLNVQRKANGDLVKKYNALFEECQKGYAAYNLLTPLQRTTNKLLAPNCGLAIVQ